MTRACRTSLSSNSSDRRSRHIKVRWKGDDKLTVRGDGIGRRKGRRGRPRGPLVAPIGSRDRLSVNFNGQPKKGSLPPFAVLLGAPACKPLHQPSMTLSAGEP